MSIKIYYGLKVTNASLFFQELTEYKQNLMKKYNTKALTCFFTNELLCNHDFISKKKYPTTKEVNEFYNKFVGEFQRNKSYRNLSYQNPYDLSLNYWSNENLIIPYFENEEHYKKLIEFKSIEEYGYWDNTDQDESVSELEWSKRKEIWTRTTDLKNYTYPYPYANCLTISIFEEQVTPSIIQEYENIKKNQLHAAIQYQVFKKIIKLVGTEEEKQLEININNSSNTKSIRTNIQLLSNTKKELMSKHGQKIIDELIENIKNN